MRVPGAGGGRGVASHQGDLAEAADPRGEGLAEQVEQPEVHQVRAVGIGGVLADRQVGLVAEQLVQRVVALAVGRHDLLRPVRRPLVGAGFQSRYCRTSFR